MINRSFLGYAMVLALFGCSSEEATPDETTRIHMGAVFSQTGVSAVSTWTDAFRLAANDLTEGLRLADYPTGRKLSFDYAVKDTRNDPAVSVEEALGLVNEKGVKLLINGTSSDTAALGKLAYDTLPGGEPNLENDINVPIVCVACSSPGLHNTRVVNEADPAAEAMSHNRDKWIFGLAMASGPQSRVLWNILNDKTPSGNLPGDLNGDGTAKISTIALADAFGTGFQDAMEAVLTEVAPHVKFERTTHAKDANVNSYDWTSAIQPLLDNRTGTLTDAYPDVIIEFTFPQFSLALVKAYTGDVPFMHTHSMRERTVVLSAVSKLDDQEGTSYLPSDGLSGEMFDARFNAFAKVARQSQWDSGVYDAAFLFGLGTVKATKDMATDEEAGEVTGAAIRDAMLDLNDPDGAIIRVGPEEFAKGAKLIAEGKPINYEGASGPCDFDAAGRARNRISHWRVVEGDVVELATYDCVEDELTCPKME